MFPHRCIVKRVPSVIEGAQETTGEPQVVTFPDCPDGIPCLIECLGAFRQKTLLGDLSVLRYQFSWGTQVLMEGDTIEFQSQQMVLKINARDTLRPVEQTGIEPFQTGILEEVA